MSERNDSLLLEDMLEAAERILQYTNGMDYESFLKDMKTIDATIRNFEIIGEAANQLDKNFKIQYPEIE